MDKRDLSQIFRDRLGELLVRSAQNRSQFSAQIGVDRSALSQLLTGASTRLPRAETLLKIAQTHQVSLDWLLGLSQDQGTTGEIKPSIEIAQSEGSFNSSLLAQWHHEALGTKIRYVPSSIPDLLRTEEIIDWEARSDTRTQTAQRNEMRYRIDYNRRPETDMEVCMPRQNLELFARGEGIWTHLDEQTRKRQLEHMVRLIDDLYPTFRLYLFDGRANFSIPYTIFGPYRVAIYGGGMYLVLNATNTIQTLTRHFDGLIRAAQVQAHESAKFMQSLIEKNER